MDDEDLGKSILQAGDSLHIHIPEADNNENILPMKMDLLFYMKMKIFSHK